MTPIKPEFRQKLVDLGVEKKFMDRLEKSCFDLVEPIDTAIEYLNGQPNGNALFMELLSLMIFGKK